MKKYPELEKLYKQVHEEVIQQLPHLKMEPAYLECYGCSREVCTPEDGRRCGSCRNGTGND